MSLSRAHTHTPGLFCTPCTPAARRPSLHTHSLPCPLRTLPWPPLQDDLVFLPAKVAAAYGNIGPLVLCTRVTSAFTFTDPLTLRQGKPAGASPAHPCRCPALRMLHHWCGTTSPQRTCWLPCSHDGGTRLLAAALPAAAHQPPAGRVLRAGQRAAAAHRPRRLQPRRPLRAGTGRGGQGLGWVERRGPSLLHGPGLGSWKRACPEVCLSWPAAQLPHAGPHAWSPICHRTCA